MGGKANKGELAVEKQWERYLDFSANEKDVDAFRSASDTHPDLAQYAAEIQRYMLENNPVTAIRGLIALQAATSAGFMIGAGKSQTITNALLAAITLLLAYIGYVLS